MTMIGNNFTDAARANWATVPGRRIDMINNEAGNPETILFSENGNVFFAQYLSYDEDQNVTSVECKTE